MSINPTICDLIQAELDGVATDAEQAKLRDAIARDPAVRDEYRRLRGLCEILDRVEPAAPPGELAGSVMRAVRARRATGSGGILGRFRNVLPSRGVALRYAYAVAAGVVIGVFGLHLASGGTLFGPVVPERDAGATIAPPAAVARLDLAPAGAPGFATLKHSASGTELGVDLKGSEPVEFLLRFDPGEDGGRVDVVVVRDGKTTEAGTLKLSR